MIADYADQLARGEELQFRTSRKQMATFGALALVFAIIGLCMIWSSDGVVVQIGGWLALIFFGIICVPIAIFRAISPSVQLTVSDQGVWTRSADLWVPWSAIAMVDRASNGSTSVLALAIKEEAVESVLGVTPQQRAEMAAEEASQEEATPGEDAVPDVAAVALPGSLTISDDELGHLLASEVVRRAAGAQA